MVQGGGGSETVRLEGIDHLGDSWMAWRLILKKVVTLTELETSWSIDDLADATDALDSWERAEREANQKAMTKK